MATNKGFTLLEVLIVIALITIIAVIALVVLNITSQVDKARDGRRKNELATLQTALEDYYNDHGCYPQASETVTMTPLISKKVSLVPSRPSVKNAISAAASQLHLLLPHI